MALQQCASTLRGPYRQAQVSEGRKAAKGRGSTATKFAGRKATPNGGFSGSQRIVGAGMLYQ
ncbi:hypothetical protein [Burkholderia ubonensis]|uniref:Uncharacterized protein n=1 Tax=Burkholderia ubonensis TaxID=101571 RepID=A0A1R1J4U2_9BURK|nr:hypothetical protein [Burkholderia ubonensis]OMG70343.1 hypothetical protein BW685_25560 [Burkholderia ubonensis]